MIPTSQPACREIKKPREVLLYREHLWRTYGGGGIKPSKSWEGEAERKAVLVGTYHIARGS